MGGLPRRNEVIAELRAAGPVLVADAGGSLVVRDAIPTSEAWPQAVVKAELVAEAIALAGIDAMAVGGRDWLLGLPKILALRDAHHLPIFAANLVCEGKRPFPSGKVASAGGHTFGFVGLTSGEVEGCTVEPPAEALARALEGLDEAAARAPGGGGVEVVVVLAAVELSDIPGLATAAPGIDFVIDGRSGRRLDDPEDIGPAWWLAHGFRGQNVGVVGLDFAEGPKGWLPAGRSEALAEDIATWRERRAGAEAEAGAATDARYAERAREQATWYGERIAEAEAERAALAAGVAGSLFTWTIQPLDASLGDHPATAALVTRGKERIAEVEQPAEPIVLGDRAVAEGPWAGSDACQSCHPAEHAQWAGTGHARAWASLEGFGRSLDRQCIGCHVTAWGVDGGPGGPAAVGPYRDVQCEACHGAGRAHAAAPAEVDMVRAPPVETCTACHDGVQDKGRFDAEVYLPRVAHEEATAPPLPPGSP